MDIQGGVLWILIMWMSIDLYPYQLTLLVISKNQILQFKRKIWFIYDTVVKDYSYVHIVTMYYSMRFTVAVTIHTRFLCL